MKQMYVYIYMGNVTVKFAWELSSPELREEQLELTESMRATSL